MLVVRIELWPLGDESQARTVALARIWNDGTGDTYTGNYYGQIVKTEEDLLAQPSLGEMRKIARVKNHSRLQSPWALVGRFIRKWKP